MHAINPETAYKQIAKAIPETKPGDFLPLKTWFLLHGKPAFSSDKMLHYHTRPIQKELIEAGAMARVGVHIFLHKTRFWPEYQRLMAESY